MRKKKEMEVKIKDFRIGNYVLFGEIIAEIIEIRPHPREDLLRLKYDRTDSGMQHCPLVEISRIKPILLTVDILEQFGFPRVYIIERDNGSIMFNISGFWYLKNYLHETQNLCHALTTQELTKN